MINVDVNICINVAWLNMLEELMLIILSLTATSVIDHLLDLIIWRKKRTCTGGQVPVATPAAKKQHIGGAVPVASAAKKRCNASEFKSQKTCRSFGGAVEQFTLNMKEVNHLSALKKAIAVFAPAMATFQREHRTYKFQIAVCVLFQKAIDPAVVTQPPLTLTSEMVAVYSDASPPLGDLYRQLLNLIEVYERNGSG